ncbi:type IVB secretion system protein IcmH/DotU [Tropicimonas sp. S265A]|uniref:type IVB secretion system protein IcmH/DotU n=1 Tax=Tropicimonas sp. S265A TaxID=3415134 RepID=UPI003C7ABB7E
MVGNPPDDDDPARTVIVPNPGGRRPRPVPKPAEPQAPAGPFEQAATPAAPPASGAAVGVPDTGPAGTPPTGAEQGTDQFLTGMNPLNANAATLFALVSRVRSRAQAMDINRLRNSAVTEIRDFEARCVRSGIDPQKVRVARYAICATLDDVVLNTPWGGNSDWAQRSLVGTFEKETVSGDKFFQMLQRLQQEPAQNLDLLEFVQMCLSVGFEGRLRVEAGGADKHLDIRRSLARTIRTHRGPVDRDLSPHWTGRAVPFKSRSLWLPVWITLGSLAAVLGIVFLSFVFLLNGRTEQVIGMMIPIDQGPNPVLERRAPPPPAPPPPPDPQVDRVKSFLEAEIAARIVSVFEDANTVTVRINGAGMFAPASDALQDAFLEPLQRVGRGLNGETGNVIIAGHSDNIPINTARFPSNYHLSLDRAKSVQREMANWLDDPGRLSAEGRSDAEPIASNDTREGRALNRRIEIILIKEGG